MLLSFHTDRMLTDNHHLSWGRFIERWLKQRRKILESEGKRRNPKAPSCFTGWGWGQRARGRWEGHCLRRGQACALVILTSHFVSGTILYRGGATLDNVWLVFATPFTYLVFTYHPTLCYVQNLLIYCLPALLDPCSMRARTFSGDSLCP